MAAPTVSAVVWDNRRMTPQSRLLLTALLAIGALLGAGAALVWRHSRPPLELTTGSYLSPRRPLPDFSLIDQRGQPFGSQNLRGHWSLMFFGYTECPDFCPSTLSTLAAMEKRMRARRESVPPQVIFVSVDAKRDTPEQLAKYVPYFDPQFIGLTAADQPTIEAVARKLGVGVTIEPQPDGSYAVYHSGAIFVVDPAGRLAAILTQWLSEEALQADIEHITAARG